MLTIDATLLALVLSCTILRGITISLIVCRFYNGLGLGTFLGRLFEERFAEVTGAEGMVSVWKALDVLEDAALSEEPNR